MKTPYVILFLVVAGLVASAAGAYAQGGGPVVNANGIVSAATYKPVGLPDDEIAQGGFFAIFGQNLGPNPPVAATSWPLPTAAGLGGTIVEVTEQASGRMLKAIVLYASPNQVNAVMPSSVSPATVNVVVRNAQTGLSSPPRTVKVVTSNFGVFTANAQGNGQAAMHNFYVGAAMRLNNVLDAVTPGQVGVLWGSGLGAVNYEEQNPPPSDIQKLKVNTPIEVWVGGQKSPQILYQGRSGSNAGVDQINFMIPSGAQGCFVPVVVKTIAYAADGTATVTAISNAGTIAIAPSGGACGDDQISFTGMTAQSVTANGVKNGHIILARMTDYGTSGTASVSDTAWADFYKLDYAGLLQWRGQMPISSYGSCIVTTFAGSAPPAFTMPYVSPGNYSDLANPTWLNAGSSLTVTAPDGRTMTLTAQNSATAGHYTAVNGLFGAPSDFYGSGVYALSSSGSTAANGLPAFSVNPIAIPAPFSTIQVNGRNLSETSLITRQTPLEIRWSGGGPFVSITGKSVVATPQAAGAIFTCTATGDAGRFTVPPEVLQALPAGTDGSVGTLMVGTWTAPKTFSVPGLDIADVTSAFTSSKTVTYSN